MTISPSPDSADRPPVVADAALDWSVDGLFHSFPVLSARRRMSRRQLIGMIAIIVVVIGAFVYDPVFAGTVMMSTAIVLYIAVLWMRVDLVLRNDGHSRYEFSDEFLLDQDDDTLPTYTVLVPAYREPEVIGSLVANLAALDYPANKLEIKLLLEADDDETVAAARAMHLQPPFEIVLIPPKEPRTKPKALNYALLSSTGELVTIYDAEDRPDPMQLRKVAATFAVAGADVGCVQAELAYFNADENIITRWFATEYRMWFTQFLPSLSKVNAPIPLGGTSNHIRRDLLIAVGAWDPFNVTEDADLGIRLRRCGYRVAVLDSITYEEANTDFVNWIKQRSRWYKGYAQTWLVHMRHPLQLIREVGVAGFLRFNLFVGGTPLLAVMNPISWFLLLLWFALEPAFIQQIMPAPVYYAGLFGWIVGNFSFYYLNLIVSFDLGLRRVFRAALLLPVYWVMMALAATKAFIQLIFNPSYWEKTQHGLSHQSNVEAQSDTEPALP